MADMLTQYVGKLNSESSKGSIANIAEYASDPGVVDLFLFKY